eukprot:UN08546
MHKPKQYKCKECNKSFGMRYLLERHGKIHMGVKSFRCNVCRKRFVRQDCLTKHKKSVHKLN